MGEANEDASFAGTGGASYSVGEEDKKAIGRDTYPTNLLAGVFMQIKTQSYALKRMKLPSRS